MPDIVRIWIDLKQNDVNLHNKVYYYTGHADVDQSMKVKGKINLIYLIHQRLIPVDVICSPINTKYGTEFCLLFCTVSTSRITA